MILTVLMVLSTAVIGVGSVAASSGTPIVDASSGTTTYTVGGAGVVVDPGMVVSDSAGGTYDGARVVIQNLQAGDQLAFTAQGGISGSFDGSSGVLTLAGTATAVEYQAVFRSVTYSSSVSSPDLSDRQISFSIGANLPNDDNGHFYEFVPADDITWTAARDDAASRTFFGLQGYLVTVTSAEENTFVASKLQGQGWLGASDAASEGTWTWVTGPEAGTHFSNQDKTGICSANTILSGVGGQYVNWQAGEPNDCYGEDYAHFRTSGEWNDYPDLVGPEHDIQGYVVEYGGMASDPTVTWQDTKTVALTVPPTNVGPEISADADSVTADEGSTATNGGSYRDDDGDPVTLSASVGAIVDNNDGTWSWSLPVSDGPAVQLVTVTADDGEESSSASFEVTVFNVAPELSADVDDSGVAGSPVSASGSFTDAGVADIHTVTVDWGDGTSSTASVTQGAGSGSFVDSHAYATGGFYDVTVTVADDNGGVDSYTESITVAHLATIDVKPDSSENPVNPKAKGVLPVAIINTGDFDLTQVDESTLSLAATEGGAGAAAAHGGHLEDVDDDGDLDLMLHFVNQDIGLSGDTTTVYLSGFMSDGVPIVGSDMVDPVPVRTGNGDDADASGSNNGNVNGNGNGKGGGR